MPASPSALASDIPLPTATPAGSLERYPEANVSARVPAVLARRLKIAAAELSATHGKVKVAELLAAILAEYVDNRDEEKLARLGELLDRYRQP
jgi:hypothetical protein